MIHIDFYLIRIDHIIMAEKQPVNKLKEINSILD
jgi:hypothetical protein